jgi:type II secretory pathway component PulC
MPMSAEQRASKNAASQVDDAQRARQEAAAKDPNKILEMLRRDLSGMM